MEFTLGLKTILVSLIAIHAGMAYPQGNQSRSQAVEQALSPAPKSASVVVKKHGAKLSAACELAAASLLSGEFASCADIIGLVSLVGHKDSIVPPIVRWVSGVCGATQCSKQGLASASQRVKMGCATDMKEGSLTALAIYSIISHYDVTRDLLCTQYKANATFCLPSVLQNIEAQSGQKIRFKGVVSLMTGAITKTDLDVLSVPKETFCNECGHAIVTQSATMVDAIRKDREIPTFHQNTTESVHQISEMCGAAAFEDRKLPHNIHVAAPHKSHQHPQMKSPPFFPSPPSPSAHQE